MASLHQVAFQYGHEQTTYHGLGGAQSGQGLHLNGYQRLFHVNHLRALPCCRDFAKIADRVDLHSILKSS